MGYRSAKWMHQLATELRRRPRPTLPPDGIERHGRRGHRQGRTSPTSRSGSPNGRSSRLRLSHGEPGAGRPPPLLEMRGITKRFPGVVALQDVSLHLRRGEVLALTGENGAGQVHADQDAGRRPARRTRARSWSTAAPVRFAVRPRRAAAGHRAHPPGADAGAEPRHRRQHLPRQRGGPAGLLAPLPQRSHARGGRGAAARGSACTTRPRRPSRTPHRRRDADGRDRQGARSARARIIVMDEPTSSLTAAESEQLFQIVRQLRAEGIAIVYISHRMEEVLDLADRVTRPARRQARGRPHARGGHPRQDRGPDGGARAVGRLLPAPPGARRRREPMLEVQDLLVPGAPAPSSLHRLPRRDPRLRRPRRIGADGADADDLRRDAGARAARCARGPRRSRRARPATRSAAACSWRPRTASGTASCCR